MPAEGLYRPTDIDLLRMENELLAYENAFLKARVAEQQRALESLAPAAPPEGAGRASPGRQVWNGVKRSPLGPAVIKLRRSPTLANVVGRVARAVRT